MFEGIIGLAGLGMQLFGGFGASKAAAEQAHYMEEAAYHERLQDQAKKEQMVLEAERQRRDIVRKNIAAHSMALTAATSNGNQEGSVLAGAYGGIQEQTSGSMLALNQNVELGTKVFQEGQEANKMYAAAGQAKAEQANDMALSSLGGALMGSAGTISRVGSFAFGKLSGFASSLQNQNSVDLAGGIWPA